MISPYCKVSHKIKQLLEDKDRIKLDIRLVYGKNDLKPSENNWLKSLRSIRISFCENLHAKCYLNENEAIITSMNLYEYSQINNNEMGIYINRSDEPDIYNEILSESLRLVRISKETKNSVHREPGNNNKPKSQYEDPGENKKLKNQPQSKIGYCIRCKTEIKLDPKSPYCRKCYKSWKKYEDENYEEKYCHICGKRNRSSLIKPGCWDCYTKYMYDLEFPLV